MGGTGKKRHCKADDEWRQQQLLAPPTPLRPPTAAPFCTPFAFMSSVLPEGDSLVPNDCGAN